MSKFINKLQHSIILASTMLVLLQSCSDDYLDYQPIDEVSSKDWFKNIDQFEMFINGAYVEYTHEHASAETWIICGNNLLNDFYTRKYTYYEILDPSFTWTNQLWEFHFRVINKMNIVLSNIDKLTDSLQRTRVEAEARFLRGYSNLMLTRAYGEIPIKKNAPNASETTSYPKNSVSDVMAFVIEDLSFAVNHLPEKWTDWRKLGYETGRPLKGSALGFRMLAYMYDKKYSLAINDYKDIEASKRGYGLLTKYRDNFTLANENSIESLFEIQYQGFQAAWGRPSNTQWLNEMTMPQTNTTKKYSRFGGWYLYDISAEFCNSFEPGDLRRKSCILGENEKFVGELFAAGDTFILKPGLTVTGFACTKYWVGFEHAETDANIGSSLNLIQLRFAEVVLNYAECLARENRLAEAYNQLNRVRLRAGLPEKPAAGLETFMNDITTERRHECFAEPNVWFDLVRSEMASATLKNTYGIDMKPHWKYYPVPQYELDTNTKMKQNEGY